MAALSLREYVQKIENLIENNEVDQAIAHCKYILKMYPKHIDSYRLLGKAFLEKQKFSDASDIFQRVLSSIPDDFISHIGMSIIREDENNVDASIWHMERAFEVQPSNKAVQDELRRLYTKRDGVAPPKIRLTRGALVRMYVRGELYEQAIGEITTTLEEDPNRIDLEVMLAKIYFLLGQKVEATEICSKVISKLPYSYEANKILTEILPGTTREEDQKIFRQRVIDLDPYFEFTSDEIQSTDQIPDSRIMVDYYEWDPYSDVNDQSDWTKSIGLSIENDNPLEKDITFWINSTENDLSQVDKEEKEEESDIAQESEIKEEFIADIEESFESETKLDDILMSSSLDVPSEVLEEDKKPEEIILSEDSSNIYESDATNINNELPDWIRDAGWEKSQETDSEIEKGFTIPPQSFETEEKKLDNLDTVDIEPGNIPDWIKEIAPIDEMGNEKVNDPEDEIGLQNLEDLISKFDSADNASIIDETISSWESEFKQDDDRQQPFSDGDLEKAGKDDQESEDNLSWLQSFTEKDLQLNNDLTLEEPEEIMDLEGKSLFQAEHSFEETTSESESLDGIDSLIKKDDLEEPLKPDFDDISPEEIVNTTEEIPDWIKSVVDENEPSLESDLISSSIPAEVEEELNISDTFEELTKEPEDEFTIVFDESDNIPESPEIELEGEDLDFTNIKLDELVTSEVEGHSLSDKNLEELVGNDEEKFELSELILDDLVTSEEVQQENVEIGLDEFALSEEANQESSIAHSSELVDEEEEKIAKEALSQLEEEVFQANNELDPLREEFELSEFVEEKDETLPEVEDEKENLESTLAWMAGITAFEASQKDLKDENSEPKEIISESRPEWLSIEANQPSEEEIDFDATPSWLKELEIEADSLSEQNLDTDVIKSINEIEIDDKVDEFEQFIPSTIVEEETEDNLLVFEEEMQPGTTAEIDPYEETKLPIEETVSELPDVVDEEIEEIEEIEEVEEVALEGLVEEGTEELHEELSGEISEEVPEESQEEFSGVSTTIEPLQEVEKLDEDLLPVYEEPSSNSIEKFEEAKHHLESGEIDKCLDIFDRLIKENNYLEDIINNIQAALDHHYPINIGLWKTLGDAYFKDNQLQKALDAYSKAEDLLS